MVFCTVCGKENEDNSNYCSKCGHSINEENKEALTSDSINLETNEKNQEKEKWIKRIVMFSVVWGLLYLLIVPLLSAALFVFAILLYITKSFKTIYYFGVVWILLGLLQVVIGIDHLYDQLFYMLIIGSINFVLGVWIVLHNKKIVINSNN